VRFCINRRICGLKYGSLRIRSFDAHRHFWKQPVRLMRRSNFYRFGGLQQATVERVQSGESRPVSRGTHAWTVRAINPASAQRTVWRGHGSLARGGNDYYPEARRCQESSEESCFRSVPLAAIRFHDWTLDRRAPNHLCEIQFHFIDIAPPPAFARLDRPHDGVLGRVKVLRRMPVLRRIATAHVAANHAQPQMHPGVAHLQALAASVAARLQVANLIPVSAFSHRPASSFVRASSASPVTTSPPVRGGPGRWQWSPRPRQRPLASRFPRAHLPPQTHREGSSPA